MPETQLPDVGGEAFRARATESQDLSQAPVAEARRPRVDYGRQNLDQLLRTAEGLIPGMTRNTRYMTMRASGPNRLRYNYPAICDRLRAGGNTALAEAIEAKIAPAAQAGGEEKMAA